MIGYSAMVYMFLWWYLGRQNAKRDAGAEDYKVEGMSDEAIVELGDGSPRYRYTI
jgi:hypothetical protein